MRPGENRQLPEWNAERSDLFRRLHEAERRVRQLEARAVAAEKDAAELLCVRGDAAAPPERPFKTGRPCDHATASERCYNPECVRGDAAVSPEPRTTDRPSQESLDRLAQRERKEPTYVPPPGGAIPIADAAVEPPQPSPEKP